MRREMDGITQTSEDKLDPFTTKDLEEALGLLKPGKAAGLDGITTELIQHFGSKAKAWTLALINKCAETCTVPKMWRKARVVALLKPGKYPTSNKRYRPIWLLNIL